MQFVFSYCFQFGIWFLRKAGWFTTVHSVSSDCWADILDKKRYDSACSERRWTWAPVAPCSPHERGREREDMWFISSSHHLQAEQLRTNKTIPRMRGAEQKHTITMCYCQCGFITLMNALLSNYFFFRLSLCCTQAQKSVIWLSQNGPQLRETRLCCSYLISSLRAAVSPLRRNVMWLHHKQKSMFLMHFFGSIRLRWASSRRDESGRNELALISKCECERNAPRRRHTKAKRRSRENWVFFHLLHRFYQISAINVGRCTLTEWGRSTLNILFRGKATVTLINALKHHKMQLLWRSMAALRCTVSI